MMSSLDCQIRQLPISVEQLAKLFLLFSLLS